MKPSIRSTRLCTLLATAAGFAAAAMAAPAATASSYGTIYDFQGPASDGAVSNARLTYARGVFFGTTTYGGTGSCATANQPNGCGTVYSVTPGTGVETVVYNFQGGSDGALPFGHVIYAGGALYGTTESGGMGSCTVLGSGCGTVYKLERTKTGWTESVVYSFTGGTDGANPYGALLAGAGGALYGTTTFGGDDAKHCNEGSAGTGCGVVFALTSSGESVLHTFEGGTDGANPQSDLIVDSSGTLYSTTTYGGNSGCNVGCGTAFTLSQSDGSWAESIIYTFQGGNDAAWPKGPLLMNSKGVLYGTTELGGGSGCDGDGCGTVYEMSPQGGGNWTEAPIYSFQGGDDSWYPESGVIRGPHGVLYGTAYGLFDVGTTGNRYGTVFELLPGKRGASWTFDLLHGFTNDPDGRNPYAGLVERKGALYGTTNYGGDNNGTIFSLTP